MKKILLDVDGVLADTMGHTMRLLQVSEKLGKHDGKIVDPDKFYQWDFFAGMSESMRGECKRLWASPYFWATIPLTSFGGVFKETHPLLSELGCSFDFATAPCHLCDGWESVRRQWISENFENIYWGTDAAIHIKEDKTTIKGDLIIDDKPATVKAFLDEGRKALLFCTEFNMNHRDGLPVVYSFMDFVKELAKL